MIENRPVTVTRTFTFNAAHVLPWHAGRCSRLHGHTYKLQVSVTDHLTVDGIVVDFEDLKKAVWSAVLGQLDHSFLNEIIVNPTAERVALYVLDALVQEGIIVSGVRLWETPECFVEVTP
jgi:6-pyruvoyltetrahydropterin/6-carboxytetrahydropterin synthase